MGTAAGGIGAGIGVLVGADVLVGDSVGVGCVSLSHAVTKATASRPINPTIASCLSECLMRPFVRVLNAWWTLRISLEYTEITRQESAGQSDSLLPSLPYRSVQTL